MLRRNQWCKNKPGVKYHQWKMINKTALVLPSDGYFHIYFVMCVKFLFFYIFFSEYNAETGFLVVFLKNVFIYLLCHLQESTDLFYITAIYPNITGFNCCCFFWIVWLVNNSFTWIMWLQVLQFWYFTWCLTDNKIHHQWILLLFLLGKSQNVRKMHRNISSVKIQPSVQL